MTPLSPLFYVPSASVTLQKISFTLPLSVCLSFCLSIRLSVYLSIHLTSIYHFIYLPIILSIYVATSQLAILGSTSCHILFLFLETAKMGSFLNMISTGLISSFRICLLRSYIIRSPRRQFVRMLTRYIRLV